MYLGLVLAAVHMKLAIKKFRVFMPATARVFSILFTRRPGGPAMLIPRDHCQFVYGGETTLSECKTGAGQPLGYGSPNKHFLRLGLFCLWDMWGSHHPPWASLGLHGQYRVSWQGCELCSFSISLVWAPLSHS